MDKGLLNLAGIDFNQRIIFREFENLLYALLIQSLEMQEQRKIGDRPSFLQTCMSYSPKLDKPTCQMYIQMYTSGGPTMKTITFTDFRKNASDFISKVEQGETLVVFRRGKPVAEIIPFSDESRRVPSWKKPGIRLQMHGCDLSSVIVQDREEDQ